MSFFAQMAACVRAGQLVAVSKRPGLLQRYATAAPRTTARFALFAGARNRCFLPESQRLTYEYLRQHRRGDTLHVLPTYGHLDVFLGRHAADDVFPAILGELNRPTTATTPDGRGAANGVGPTGVRGTMVASADKTAEFRRLHASGCFVMPNPWDAGSARALAGMGFKALATTSSGFAWTTGRPDNTVGLDETLAHLRLIAAAVDLPVNADFQNGFAAEPEGWPRTSGSRCRPASQGCRSRTSRAIRPSRCSSRPRGRTDPGGP